MSERFRYAIDMKFFPLLLPFGVRPSKDGVTLTDDGRFVATFGFFRIETEIKNIDEAHVTSGYRWWTAIGARGSLVDDGLTFGTNHDAGVCVHFHERVGSVLRRSGHSALTVTVADLEGLIEALDGKTPNHRSDRRPECDQGHMPDGLPGWPIARLATRGLPHDLRIRSARLVIGRSPFPTSSQRRETAAFRWSNAGPRRSV